MESRYQFQRRVKEVLEEIEPEILSYNEEDYWMIQAPYEYIEYYAAQNRFFNTAVALPLCRGLHDGVYRKSGITKNGKHYRLPYAIHCLRVCEMLVNLTTALTKEEKDILLAAALCHDMIEDIPFPENGKELVTKFHLNPRVYETVLLVSKERDFTKEQERAHFHSIESNRLSLLLKLSDRGNNVEDLYNMSCWKVHEYVGETREYFLPMVAYGFTHYPELIPPLEILRDKILTLTEIAEVLVSRYEVREQKLIQELEELKEENQKLRQEWSRLWNEDEEGGEAEQ